MLLRTRQLLPLACFIIFVAASSFAHSPYQRQQRCASDEPSEALHALHHYLQYHEPLENDLWNSSLTRAHTAQNRPYRSRNIHFDGLSNPSAVEKRQSSQPFLTIDIYFHIVADNNNSDPGSTGYVTDQMVSDQFTYLSDAYATASITFNLLGVTRTVNDTWAQNGDDRAMKTALRQGTYSTLNVYYQTLLQSNGENGVPVGFLLLGYCSLPQAGITSTTPRSAYIVDGCNIFSGTMPGSDETGYNHGGTSVHEIGHWNGLLHPFQGQTCDPDNFGDYVADTPQESVPTYGCPASKDSCPNSGVTEESYDGVSGNNPYGPSGYSGPDPIHNFMDYSDDACYTGFTRGQAARMLNLWTIYREGL